MFSRYTNHFLVSEIKREVEGGNDVQLNSGFIVLAASTFGITKLLTIDYNYWHVSSSIYH